MRVYAIMMIEESPRAMAAAAFFTTTWFDRSTPWGLLCSILKVCDSAQGVLWQDIVPRGHGMGSIDADALFAVWDNGSVMRTNTVEVYVTPEQMPSRLWV